jgi:protein associated with RNAse G/E
MSETRVRIRGIYTTALTELCRSAGVTVVQASAPIERRFDDAFEDAPADLTIETTADRQGVGLSGEPDAVAEVRGHLGDLALDALTWPDPAPTGAVFDGVIDRTRGGGAVVALDGGGAEGYLPFDAVDSYVDSGDRVRVQVHEPAPPWSDDAPLLGTEISVAGGLLTLRRGTESVTAAASGEDATELVRTTDLLTSSPRDGWGVRWEHSALDAEMGQLQAALDRANEQAAVIDDALDGATDSEETPAEALVVGQSTAWCWFGRESRFALDEQRRAVETTMTGHHRIKAADRSASTAVDLVEAVCDDPDAEFPLAAVSRQLGPREGDRLAIAHGKPDGRLFTLGRGEITAFDPDAEQMTVRRTMSSQGSYDALGTEREPGDVAITKLTEGRWWYPTVYRGEDGTAKGTYVNVCTPIELFPDAARYVDLHVDVIKRPDGAAERVDDAELDEAVDEGHLSEALAEKARAVATAVERALA